MTFETCLRSPVCAQMPHAMPHATNSTAPVRRRKLVSAAVKVAALVGISAAAQVSAPALLAVGGGGNGGGFGGWGGGGGGGGNGRFGGLPIAFAEEAPEDRDEEQELVDGTDDDARLYDQNEVSVDEDEEDEEEEDDDVDSDDDDIPEPSNEQFYCQEIQVRGLPEGQGVPTKEDLLAGLKCQPGFTCTKEDLSEDLRQLFKLQLFDNVDGKVVAGRGRKRILVLNFVTSVHPEIHSLKVSGATIIPQEVIDRFIKERPPGPTTMTTLAQLRNIVEGWYQDNGYAYSYITTIEGLDTGHVTANISEGKVNSLRVIAVDDELQPKTGLPTVNPEIITRELDIRNGDVYNLDDGEKALRAVFALQLFDNVQIFPRPNQQNESQIDVEVLVKERPMQTTEVETEWSIAPSDSGRPGLVSLIPGGSLMYENRMMGWNGQQLSASCNTPNLIAPGDELGYRVEWKHPYFHGSSDPKRTCLSATAFNARKLSGVFISGSGDEEVPSVFIDRSGAKLSVSERYSRNSRGTLSAVVEQVSALDDQGSPAPRGSKVVQTPQGAALDPDGPPTTLSPTATDRLAFLQAALTRDTTYSANGTLVGARDVCHVEQGLGLGTQHAFFNRAVVSLTRFLKLPSYLKAADTAPPVLVVHARAGNCIGEQASYDLFTLGGPFSARGFSVGEVAACRRFLETAVELRAPVFGRQIFAFYERTSDLGSSKAVNGNPTAYYRRLGSASSFGAGIKLGTVRAEWATEGSFDKGHFFLRFGERF